MDPALWRRLVIVPFSYRFPDDQKDPAWRDRILIEEGAGILNWIVEGAKAYLADGLQVPESIADFTEGCKSEMDAISTFIEDTYFKVPAGKIKASDMRRQFNAWGMDNGYKQNFTAQNFRRELEDRGYVVQKGTGNYQYVHGLSDTPVASVKEETKSDFFDTDSSGVANTLSDTFRALRSAEAELEAETKSPCSE